MRARLVLTIAIAWLLPAIGIAQTNTGQIAGVVGDAQGGALPGATDVPNHRFGNANFGRSGVRLGF